MQVRKTDKMEKTNQGATDGLTERRLQPEGRPIYYEICSLCGEDHGVMSRCKTESEKAVAHSSSASEPRCPICSGYVEFVTSRWAIQCLNHSEHYWAESDLLELIYFAKFFPASQQERIRELEDKLAAAQRGEATAHEQAYQAEKRLAASQQGKSNHCFRDSKRLIFSEYQLAFHGLNHKVILT